MKNYALSPLIENLIMMTSQNVQINVMYLVENCLSYNISKSGRKSMTEISEITKDIMTSSMKILMRAHVRVVTRTETWIVSMLDNGRKFMCIEFG